MSLQKVKIALCILLTIATLGISSAHAANGTLPGDGSEQSPYLIEDLADFNTFTQDSSFWNYEVFTKLMCNLDLDPALPGRTLYTAAPIAPDTNSLNHDEHDGPYYQGHFDGNYHAIKNLTIQGNYYCALFGATSGSSTVNNLAVLDVNISASDNMVAPLIGDNACINISNCFTSGSVSGNMAVGGMIGLNSGNSIYLCYSHTSVTAGDYAGGFAGLTYDEILHCYSTGLVNCQGNSSGGFFGFAQNNDNFNCFWDRDSSGKDASYNFQAMGITTEQLKETAILIQNDWDFSTDDNTPANWVSFGIDQYPDLASFYTNSTDNYEEDDTSATATPLTFETTITIQKAIYPTGDADWVSFEITDGPKPTTISTDAINGTCLITLYNDQLSEINILPSYLSTVLDNGTYYAKITAQNPNAEIFTYDLTVFAFVSQLSGEGSAEEPYLISDFDDFDHFTQHPIFWAQDIHTKLMTDIDLDPCLPGRSTYTSAVLSSEIVNTDDEYNGITYQGIFDGNNHTISNMTIDTPTNHYLGLFAITGNLAVINNLTIDNAQISGADFIGILAGANDGAVIDNCSFTGTIDGDEFTGGISGDNYGIINACSANVTINSSDYLGGICGFNNGSIVASNSSGTVTGNDITGALAGANFGDITNSYSTTDTYGNDATGGLVGQNNKLVNQSYSQGIVSGHNTTGGLVGQNNGFIFNSYSSGNTTGNYAVGALTGSNDNYLSNCYSTGSVTGVRWSGGLTGSNSGDIFASYSTNSATGEKDTGGFCGYNNGIITNSYSTGIATATENAPGGFCGNATYGEIFSSFWDVQTSLIGSEGENNFGALGKTTTQMQTASTFTSAGWNLGNDGTTTWTITPENYPTLDANFTIYYSGSTTTHMEPYQTAEMSFEIFSINEEVNWEFSNQDDCPWISSITPTTGTATGVDNPTTVTISIDKDALIASTTKTFDLEISSDDIVIRTIKLQPNVILPGSGTQEDPFLINTIDDIQFLIANPIYWTTAWVHYELMADIDLTPLKGYTTCPFGPTTSSYDNDSYPYYDGTGFRAILDGNHHTLSNLTIHGTIGEDRSDSFLGLFVRIEPEGIISNLNLENIDVSGRDFIGGLCAQNSGQILNCSVKGNISGHDYIGGLCAANSGLIENSITNVNVTANSYAGGFCGIFYPWDDTYYIIALKNCYSTGSVAAHSYAGGLCGSNSSEISNSYSLCTVSGALAIGGLVGSGSANNITNSYFNPNNGTDNGFGTPLSESDLNDQQSYSGFDFEGNTADGTDDIWSIMPGHCPKLAWQTGEGPLAPTPLSAFLNGNGTEEDPFQINNQQDFETFCSTPRFIHGYYILTADINLENESFSTSPVNRFFCGHFNGQNHSLDNLTINVTQEGISYIGLFMKTSGTINNLNLNNCSITGQPDTNYIGAISAYNYGDIVNCNVNATIEGYDYIGGLTSYNEGTIEYCNIETNISGNSFIGLVAGWNNNAITHATSTGIIDGATYLGGICGLTYQGNILNSSSSCNISGIDSLGGICGINSLSDLKYSTSNGTISGRHYIGGIAGTINGLTEECYTSVTVSGDEYVGGFCGTNSDYIYNCYALGSVTGSKYVGGFCGRNNSYSRIFKSYSIGLVTGITSTGGFYGYQYKGYVYDSFWNMETSEKTIAGGKQDSVSDCYGLTTEQMMTMQTFLSQEWDFVGETENGSDDIWRMPYETGYPILAFQHDIPGDLGGSYGVDMEDLAILNSDWSPENMATLLEMANYWLAGK